MSVKGRSIRLYLVDGTPTGLHTAEIMNWTGHVLVGPRARIPDLIKRPEALRTGIYFLTAPDPDNPLKSKVYIGESDNVGRRLVRHNQKMDFWERVCVVTSKDQNLTKAHARYLEGKLIDLAMAAKRATMVNDTAPDVNNLLPESDQADMDYFVDQIRLILPVLGLNFLQTKSIVRDIPEPSHKKDGQVLFILKNKKLEVNATATEIDGEFFVLAGSTARSGETKSWTSYRGLRDQLVDDRKLIPTDNPKILRFAEDVPFASQSAASSCCLARNSNGRIEWKLEKTGQTYAEWQDSLLKESSVNNGDGDDSEEEE